MDHELASVRRAIGSGDVGQPVAARCNAFVTDPGVDLRQLAAGLLGQAAEWLGDRIERIYARESAGERCIAGLGCLSRGGSVLVTSQRSASDGQGGAPGICLQVVVWGSRGTISFETSINRPLPALGSSAAGRSGGELVERLQAATGDSWPRGSGGRIALPESPRAALAPPYGVLLISGEETHQPMYAGTFAKDPRCRLIGVTDEPGLSARRRERNALLAERLGVPLLDDLHAALTRDDVQIVSLCAEPQRRGPLIVAAAKAGKHLYLDKPLAGSAADARAAVTAIRGAGVLAHMFSQVHVGVSQRARERLRSGELGPLAAIHADLCFAKGHGGTAALGAPRRESAAPTVFEVPDAKRELSNVGVYPAVMLAWLTGQRPRAVAATTGNYFFREHQEQDLEDFGQMLLEFDDGLLATVSAGRTGWCSHPLAGLSRVALVGERGCSALDAHRPRVEIWSDAQPWSPPPRNPDDPMAMWVTPAGSPFAARPKRSWVIEDENLLAADAGHFLAALESGRESEVPVELGAAATEILMAAYASAASGSPARV